MKNKKLGFIVIILSLIITGILIQLMGGLNTQARVLGCFNNEECFRLESAFSITHIAFGIIGFTFALGIYLILFSKDEEEIIKSLEEVKNNSIKEQKFAFVLRGLDSFEKKALGIIKEQEGITQNTLRIKADMSKAKLSYVLSDLQKKELINKIKKGKTFAIFLKESFD